MNQSCKLVYVHRICYRLKGWLNKYMAIWWKQWRIFRAVLNYDLSINTTLSACQELLCKRLCLCLFGCNQTVEVNLFVYPTISQRNFSLPFSTRNCSQARLHEHQCNRLSDGSSWNWSLLAFKDQSLQSCNCQLNHIAKKVNQVNLDSFFSSTEIFLIPSRNHFRVQSSHLLYTILSYSLTAISRTFLLCLFLAKSFIPLLFCCQM